MPAYRDTCPTCPETKDTRAFQCSDCRVKFNPARKGTGIGKRLSKDGYVLVMHEGKGWLEHRLIMTKLLGRDLRSDEHVHHKNEIRRDNKLTNLQLMEASEHLRVHMLDGQASFMSKLGHRARWGCENSIV